MSIKVRSTMFRAGYWERGPVANVIDGDLCLEWDGRQIRFSPGDARKLARYISRHFEKKTPGGE